MIFSKVIKKGAKRMKELDIELFIKALFKLLDEQENTVTNVTIKKVDLAEPTSK